MGNVAAPRRSCIPRGSVCWSQKAASSDFIPFSLPFLVDGVESSGLPGAWKLSGPDSVFLQVASRPELPGLPCSPYLTFCNPVDHSLPGSSVHGIVQARILEWVVISFSRGSSSPGD